MLDNTHNNGECNAVYQRQQRRATAITTFLIAGASSMSSDDKLKLNELDNSASIADAVVNAGEFLYARKASLPKAGKILGAQLMAFRAANDWHRDADNNLVVIDVTNIPVGTTFF